MTEKPFSKFGSFEFLTSFNGLSKIGNQFYYFAAPLYLLKETQNPLTAAFFLAIQSVPYLMSSVLGSMIDGYDKRKVYIFSELIQLLSMLLIAILIFKSAIETNIIMFGFLALILQLCAIVSSLIIDYSVLPLVARDDDISKWTGSYLSIISFCRLSGPVACGFMMKFAPEYIVILINGLTFGATVGLGLFLKELKQISISKRVECKNTNHWNEFFRFKELANLALSLSIYNFGISSMNLIIITLMSSNFTSSEFSIGLTISIGGIGALIGNLIAKNISYENIKTIKRIKFVLVGCIFSCIIMIIPNKYVFTLGFFILSLFEGIIAVISTTHRQKIIPKEYVGRFNGIFRFLILSPVPFSIMLNGLIISKTNSTTLIFIPSIFFLILSCGILHFNEIRKDVKIYEYSNT